MACIITYENKQYSQKEFEQYFKEHFTEFVDNFLGSKQDIEGFKEFINTEQNIKNLSDSNSEKSITFAEINERLNGALTKNGIDEEIWNNSSTDLKNKTLKCLKF